MLYESPAIRWPLGTTPDIFRPIPLRNGNKYRALQRYRFNTEEKLWACDHIVSSCKDIESNIDDDVNRFSRRYHLRTSIVAEWINNTLMAARLLAMCVPSIVAELMLYWKWFRWVGSLMNLISVIKISRFHIR